MKNEVTRLPSTLINLPSVSARLHMTERGILNRLAQKKPEPPVTSLSSKPSLPAGPQASEAAIIRTPSTDLSTPATASGEKTLETTATLESNRPTIQKSSTPEASNAAQNKGSEIALLKSTPSGSEPAKPAAVDNTKSSDDIILIE